MGYQKEILPHGHRLWPECVSWPVLPPPRYCPDLLRLRAVYRRIRTSLWSGKLGATVVPFSSGNTERQLMLMEDFKTTALVSTPSFALYMAEVALEKGLNRQALICVWACLAANSAPIWSGKKFNGNGKSKPLPTTVSPKSGGARRFR